MSFFPIFFYLVRKVFMFSVGGSLRELSVSAISAAKCAENPLVEGSLSNTTFCGSFSAPASGSCSIDDGGAALEKNDVGRWSVVGIVSFVYGCNTANAVAGFTSVAAYSDWISSVTSGELSILNLLKLKTKLTRHNEKFVLFGNLFWMKERWEEEALFNMKRYIWTSSLSVSARSTPGNFRFASHSNQSSNSTMFRNIFSSTPIEFKSKVMSNFNQSINRSINCCSGFFVLWGTVRLVRNTMTSHVIRFPG